MSKIGFTRFIVPQKGFHSSLYFYSQSVEEAPVYNFHFHLNCPSKTIFYFHLLPIIRTIFRPLLSL